MAQRISKKALTEELAKLAAIQHTVDDDGNPVTKEQALAALVWNAALGWTEKTMNDKGEVKEVVHAPLAWAMQYIYERIDGKVAPAKEEENVRVKAAEKVREMSRDRINKLAKLPE